MNGLERHGNLSELFITRLWKVPGVEGFSAHLKFGELQIDAHRRIAADSTHAEIRAWRASGVLEAVA